MDLPGINPVTGFIRPRYHLAGPMSAERDPARTRTGDHAFPGRCLSQLGYRVVILFSTLPQSEVMIRSGVFLFEIDHLLIGNVLRTFGNEKTRYGGANL